MRREVPGTRGLSGLLGIGPNRAPEGGIRLLREYVTSRLHSQADPMPLHSHRWLRRDERTLDEAEI